MDGRRAQERVDTAAPLDKEARVIASLADMRLLRDFVLTYAVRTT